MKFKTLSPTALETAIVCPARFQVTHVDYAADEGSVAADVGTAVHGALERYVYDCYGSLVHPETEVLQPTLEHLMFCFNRSYAEVFGKVDSRSAEYTDGADMLHRWYTRTDLSDCDVLLIEQKENFPVPLPDGTAVPFNYKFDRLDRLGPYEYRVVDYKTGRLPITAEALRQKIQARCYALATQIRHKDAQRIWVVFDMLRHDSIGVVFSREDNADTWRMVRSATAELHGHSDTDPPEQINASCRYCVRAPSCQTLQSNVTAGGVEALTVPEIVDLRYTLDTQVKGLTRVIESLDSRLLAYVKETDELRIEGEQAVAQVGVSYRRSVTDARAIATMLGPELVEKYGNFRVSDVDALLKLEQLTPEQKKTLAQYVRRSPTKPTIESAKKAT